MDGFYVDGIRKERDFDHALFSFINVRFFKLCLHFFQKSHLY